MVKKDSWIRVRCPNCNEGFVSKEWLEIHLENDCKGKVMVND